MYAVPLFPAAFPPGAITEEENNIRIDILKNSDDSLLAEDLKWRPDGVDLTTYPNIASNDIKIRVKFNVLNKSPIIRNIILKPKTSW